ncbi:hypothetical protein B0T24DRAFT_356698 [Lasiosphaeria ovina]|uniref:Uncharacterized protein n=1 Tax=Lasiosphaeria ovina TaxID=92902 RepID=A0AAE0N4J2_9PEZI|nr:hypothetical protein B0T24DRAFT_356698 [Lasiosphaeria ovina]
MRRGLFVYDQRGTELAQNKFYRRTELAKFFVQHPDQQEPVRLHRRLTLWIQNTPAQLNTRYLNNSSSSKCRWRDCPDPTHTIQKGFWRVAFDEYSGHTTQNHTDPYLNAGYMHLYCFEKAFDLGYLIHHAPRDYGFRILPDNRHFPREERNAASLKRDHPEMSAVYEKWLNEQSQRSFPPGYTGFEQINVPDKDRLWSRLTEEHLRRESKTRDTTRKTRPGTGNHIAFHRGNLEMMVKTKQAEKASKKRKNKDSDEEEGGGGSDDDEGVEQPRVERPVPVPKKRRVESPLESPHRLGGLVSPGVESPHHLGGLVGLGVNNTQLGPQASGFFYYPVPDNSAGPSLHYPAPPAIPQQHGFYNIDPALAASSTTPVRPPPQGPSTPRLEPVPTSLPRTRKRSRENSEDINERLSKKPMTRGGADEIIVAMQNEPQHVRDRIISAAPASSAAILKERIQKRVLQGETLPEVHEYDFDARVGKLRTRERLNLDATLIKIEKHKDPKKNNSI